MDDDEEEIDEEQVEDYCAMLDRLGNFPEKVAINSLSMAAEDFANSPTSAHIIYNCIRSRLIDRTTPGISSPDRKLPLVYVLDSLLKNVRGVYINIIQDDAASWMSTVYDIFDKANNKENEKARLKKVWNTWKEFGVIKDEEKWRAIGECFIKAEEKAKAVADARAIPVAGIKRNADGTLQITPSLRKQMQLLLDEVQSTGVDELEKVSLERLADINPDLLQQLKEAAIEEQNQQHQQQLSTTNPSNTSPMFVSPPLSEWSKLNLNHLEKSHDLIASLQRHVRSANEMTVVKSQLDDTIHLYASVSASAQLLTDMLQTLKDGTSLGFLPGQNNTSSGGGIGSGSGGGGGGGGSRRRRKRYSLVKKENFTNEGIRQHNDAVIAQLYEVGLPFVCSADGKRFASQLELSQHLDSLFRKSQLEKQMAKTTEERGWYIVESVWMTLGRKDAVAPTDQQMLSDAGAGATALADASMTEANRTIPTTVIADESRDRCLLCGINFAMFFDQEDGEWKYKNCIEKSVEQDDGPTMDEKDELENVLVHVTCWEGLGSPECLTPDQIRHAH